MDSRIGRKRKKRNGGRIYTLDRWVGGFLLKNPTLNILAGGRRALKNTGLAGGQKPSITQRFRRDICLLIYLS